MFCPKCGTRSADESSFCKVCGLNLMPFRQGGNAVAVSKSDTNKKPDKNKLTVLIICASVVLVLAVVVFCIIFASNDTARPTKIQDMEKPDGLTGIWVRHEADDSREDLMYFVLRADGSGTLSVMAKIEGEEEDLHYSENITWSNDSSTLTLYRVAGDGMPIDDEFDYRIEGDYLYLKNIEDSGSYMPMRFISSDTSISYEEIAERFSMVKSEYEAVVAECISEYEAYEG